MNERRKKTSVPHSKRPEVYGSLHVVWRIRRGLPGLRTPRCYRVLERCFRAGKEKEGFGVTYFSVQRDHLHLIVEAKDRRWLARGLQGLAVRIAKSLNRHWNRRRGSVFSERYFARLLERPRQVFNAIRYVLNNGRKHGERISAGQADPFSSARWFQGWIDQIARPLRSAPVASVGRCRFPWIHQRVLRVDEVPSRAAFDACGTIDELLASNLA